MRREALLAKRRAGGSPRLGGRVPLIAALSRFWAVTLAATLVVAAAASAHEIQATVVDLTIDGDSLRLEFEGSAAAMVAGADLAGLVDTDATAQADEIDRLRALPPGAFAEEMRDAWPRIAEDISVTAGGAAVPLDLTDISVPDVGNVETARITRYTAIGTLPPDEGAIVLAWEGRLGPLVVRQDGAGADPYTGYLQNGGETAPIPREIQTAQGWAGAFLSYVPVGFEHIVPMGLDHILFVLGLFFLSTRIRPLLGQVTAFTAAHTLTLALAALGVVRVPAAIVEPLIAASIVYVAVENIFVRRLTPWRPVIVVGFGLLHGLGFASVLTEYGLGRDDFVAKLIGFNIGVELGQLAVIAAAFLIVSAALRPFGQAAMKRGPALAYLGTGLVVIPVLYAALAGLGGVWGTGALPLLAAGALLFGFTGAALASEGDDTYRQNVAHPASILIALVGSYWVVERTLL